MNLPKPDEAQTPDSEQTRRSSHCSTASNEEVVQEQLRFVEWLKQRGMYSEYASANEMRKMQAVWKACHRAFVEDVTQRHEDAVHEYNHADRDSEEERQSMGAMNALGELLDAWDESDASQ